MSKKSERINYLIGCRNALNGEGSSVGVDMIAYEESKIKQILSTIDAVLKLDNITPINADAKFGEEHEQSK